MSKKVYLGNQELNAVEVTTAPKNLSSCTTDN